MIHGDAPRRRTTPIGIVVTHVGKSDEPFGRNSPIPHAFLDSTSKPSLCWLGRKRNCLPSTATAHHWSSFPPPLDLHQRRTSMASTTRSNHDWPWQLPSSFSTRTGHRLPWPHRGKAVPHCLCHGIRAQTHLDQLCHQLLWEDSDPPYRCWEGGWPSLPQGQSHRTDQAPWPAVPPTAMRILPPPYDHRRGGRPPPKGDQRSSPWTATATTPQDLVA
jgi:hypothetical protein